MLRGAERGDEGVEHHPEAFLGLDRRQRRQRRLGPEEELGLRDDLRDQLPVRADRLGEAVPPDPLPLLAGGEQIGEHAPKRLGERRVGDVALAGVELPRQEDPARPLDRAQELVHEAGLPDPGVPRDERERGAAARHRLLEHRLQRGQLGLPPVEALGELEAIGDVERAERERLDAPGGAPFGPGPLEILPEAAGALVPVLGHLLHQPPDDRVEHGVDAGGDLAQRRDWARDVRVNPAQRILRGERELAGEHEEEQHPQRVEIAAAVDGAVHPSGLLGRHERQRPLDQLWRLGDERLAWGP